MWIPSDCKIADSYVIGYGHVLRMRYENGRFDVLCSVGISLTFKLLFVHVHFWIFWMKYSETPEIELI